MNVKPIGQDVTSPLAIEGQKNSSTLQEKSPKRSSYLPLKIGARAGIGLIRWGVYTTAIATTLLFTSAGNKAVNWGAKELDLLPLDTPGIINESSGSLFRADGFFENFPGANMVMHTINKLNISPTTIDLNSSGRILDNEEEINNLIKILESKNTPRDPDIEDSLNILKDYKEINKLTFGKNGLDLNWLASKSSLDWQIRMILMAKLENITEDEIHKVKNMLSISEYNLSKENFYINYIIDFNKKQSINQAENGANIEPPVSSITIPFKNLGISYKDHLNPDEPYIVAIGNYITKKVKNNELDELTDCMATSPLSISPKDFNSRIVINVNSLTNEELENILKQCNDNLIPACNFSLSAKFSNIMGDIISFESPSEHFSLSQSNFCIVKEYDENTKEVTIINPYNKTKTMSLSEFRNQVPVIALKPEDVPLFNLITLLVTGSALVVSTLTYLGANKLNRMMFPNYKSWLERAGSYLPGVRSNNQKLKTVQSA